MLNVLSVSTTSGAPVTVTVVVCAPESVCAAAIGANSSPPPSAIDTANAENEMPADSAPMCGDMLAARPFHLVIRPPRKSSPPEARDISADFVENFVFICQPKSVKLKIKCIKRDERFTASTMP